MEMIETERLILRNFEESDYEDVFEFLSQRKDDEFEAYPDITYENGREHLAYRIHSDEFVAIQLKETGKIIGNVYFGNRDFESRELGYIVNKNYQRKGYAKEAITEVLKAAFAGGVHRVFAECAPRNECSWRLLENLGFSREAFFKQNVYFKKDENGKPVWQDTYVYCLLAKCESED
ncbi:MAG: GNAT family N-acetyltransferase [Clostridiales bacterium]|nr:GNAT family N-acetyltransferase [Roseburia sp.]MDD7635732.1 GNAT family N-acetyltransferase [Clostridiales bacterium]MDY4112259.1 GNAT family N-acetyltransferase [Roseburia sp.]